MCENGLNVGQMRLSVAQVQELLGTAQGWLEQLHHVADHAHRHDASAKLAQVTVMLGEARERLDETLDTLDSSGGSDVTVQLV